MQEDGVEAPEKTVVGVGNFGGAVDVGVGGLYIKPGLVRGSWRRRRGAAYDVKLLGGDGDEPVGLVGPRSVGRFGGHSE